MILNLSNETAQVLLHMVDLYAKALLPECKRRGLSPAERHNTIVTVQHLGIAKHRLEYGLDIHPCFEGPYAWGYPLHGRPPKALLPEGKP